MRRVNDYGAWIDLVFSVLKQKLAEPYAGFDVFDGLIEYGNPINDAE